MVKKIVNMITTQSETISHTVFFDNFFYKLQYDVLKDLASIKLKAFGNIKENRTLGATKNMIGVKDMKILIKKYLIFVTTERSTSVNGTTTRSSASEATLQLIYRGKKWSAG